ncbi:MAG: tetratricopeptide repeat protein [Anaerolineae bacterium]|nr:tetratricopeptide repeat protein [Anaerolineae bacterium]
MASNYRIYLFGNVRVEKDNQTVESFDSRKALALLGYLIRQQQPVSRSQLAGLFWGEKSEARGRRNLSRELSQLSSRLPDAFQADYHNVQFQPSSTYWVDALAFEQLAQQSGRFTWTQSAHNLAELSPDMAATDNEPIQPDKLAEAVALYQGDFMSGYYLDDCPEFESWLLSQQEGWRRQVVELLETLVAYHAMHAADDQAETFARRWLALEPWQEQAHRHLMILLARNGKRAAALAQYDLCKRVLEDELGAEPEEETTALVQRIQAGEIKNRSDRRLESLATAPLPTTPPPPPVPSRPTLKIRVPSPATPMVNRTDELKQVADFFRRPGYRLMTLVGPGGIGKTRLALEAAWQVKETDADNLIEFSHGIYFVALESLSSADFLVTTLADALDFSFYSGGDPAEQLLNYLREKEMLLVLDNLEHLLSAPETGLDGAALIDQILMNAPQVKILTVSRERLNLLDEQLLPIHGLALPALPDDRPATSRLTVGDVAWQKTQENSAVQLFMQRAKAVVPAFEPSTEDRVAIIQICRLVEGIPLAIELAATWLRVLTCGEIVTEIRNNLDFLTTSLRNVPERQRSVRAVFDYSWRLLSGEEQRVFRQLAVFRGGFRREAAEAVVGASLGLLLSLIDKSLLQRMESGRFERHHLLWQYALDKLEELPAEKAEAEDRHGAYFADFLAQRTTALQGGNQRAALAEINADIENVRICWQWAIERGRWAAVEQALESLFHFYDIRSGFKEGAEAFERAASALEKSGDTAASAANPIVWGKLLARQGWFVFQLGQYEPAIELLHHSLEILRQAGDAARPALAFPLNYLGAAHRHLGEYQLAEEHLVECLEICREIKDRFGEGVALTILGQAAYLKGDYEQARQLCQESLAIKRAIGDHRGITFALHILGQVAFSVDAYSEAKRSFEESLAICQAIGDDRGIALSLSYLGDVLQKLGEYPGARQLYQESLAIFEEIGNQWGIISTRNKLGYVSNELDEIEAAADHFAVALTLAESIQAVPAMLDAVVGMVALHIKRGDFAWPPILEGLALALNHPVSSRSNQDRAARLLAELEPLLPNDTVSNLHAMSKSRTIEDIVRNLR